MSNLAHAIEYEERSLEEIFPVVPHGRQPLLTHYLVQKPLVRRKTKAGIVVVEETVQAEQDTCTLGKVIAISPQCFHDKSGVMWYEGPSFAVGDYLQIPRFGGFRFAVPWQGESVEFVMFDHLQQIAKITGDPRKITTYL